MLVVAEGLSSENLKRFNGRQCTLLTLVNDEYQKYFNIDLESLEALANQWFAFCPDPTATPENEIHPQNMIRLPEANMNVVAVAMPKIENTQELEDGQLVYYDHGEPRYEQNLTLNMIVLQGVCKVKTVDTVRRVVCPYASKLGYNTHKSFTLDAVAIDKLKAIHYIDVADSNRPT